MRLPNKLTTWYRIATRYDRSHEPSLASVARTSARLWLPLSKWSAGPAGWRLVKGARGISWSGGHGSLGVAILSSGPPDRERQRYEKGPDRGPFHIASTRLEWPAFTPPRGPTFALPLTVSLRILNQIEPLRPTSLSDQWVLTLAFVIFTIIISALL